MYCIKCGVKLNDTEKKCPLCHTAVYHPELEQQNLPPLYPESSMPKIPKGSKMLCGAVIIIFLIPLIVSFFSDMQNNGRLDWFGYVAGALILGYIVFALPFWFRRPNPVIFLPCDIAAAGLYILYIDLAVGGGWFLPFAFPVLGGFGLISCATVTLLFYLRRGRLYIFGGASMAAGAMILLTEFLMSFTFGIRFIGWSLYPLAVLFLLGGLLIYLAINASAREMMERKLFF